jgi:hypothetical protein
MNGVLTRRARARQREHYRSPMLDNRARRGALVLVALVASLAACGGDDDDSGDEGSATTQAPAEVSTEGACSVLDIDDVSEVLGADFDKATLSDSACTYTSSRTPIAMTLHVTDLAENEPAMVLETMGDSCDDGTVEERMFTGADGGFSCLAGGVPNVVATGQGVLLVLVGNSREPDVDRDAILAGLVTILEDAIADYDSDES